MVKILLTAMIVFGLAVTAPAKIYTWVDASGVRHYSDTAAAPSAEKADLPGVQTIESSDQALTFAKKQVQKQQAEQKKQPEPVQPPQIASPQSRATIRNGNGSVPVAVALGPQGLATGQSLTYRLDGQRTRFSPTTQTSLSLSQVERGTHTLSVAITRNGKTLARSRNVTFYVKPPSAITPLNRVQPAAPAAPAAGSAAGVNGAPTISGRGPSGPD